MSLDKISPTKVDNEGTNLKNHATKIMDILNQVKQSMDSTKSALDSKGGEAIRKNFNDNAAKFQDFKTQIDNYGQYLIDYAKEHSDADNKIAEVAESYATISTK